MKKFKTVLEFGNTFNTEERCFSFLCELKWGEGFCCRKCAHPVAIKGRTWHYRKCQKCKYDESCTAHTLFHKLKFPVTRAFMIIHQLSTLKKGISTCEISRQFHIHQETAWFFKRKVQQAMYNGSGPISLMETDISVMDKLSKHDPEEDEIKADEKALIVTIACQNSNIARAKTLVVAISCDGPIPKNQKLSKTIWTDGEHSSAKELYRKFKLNFQFNPGENASSMKWYIYNLKHWMRGIHHLISLAHLQRYLNEFQYRFERRTFSKWNPADILRKMVELPWLPYSKAKWN